MTAQPDYVKLCYRCDAPVRLTRAAYEADDQTWTTCDVCRAKLAVEAAAIGTEFPKGPNHQPDKRHE